MFKDWKSQKEYLIEHYPDVSDSRIDANHWDLKCNSETCKGIVRGFQVVRYQFLELEGLQKEMLYSKNGDYSDLDDDEAKIEAPVFIKFKCPVCGLFKIWLVYELWDEENDKDFVCRVISLPGEESNLMEFIPEKYSNLRKAYREAVIAKNAGANIASAAMYRRALQAITREVLGVKPKKLLEELNEIKGIEFEGVTIDKDFSDNAYITRKSSNPAAHIDKDPDLLDFSSEDMNALEMMFGDLIYKLFILPKVKSETKEKFLESRKIKLK